MAYQLATAKVWDGSQWVDAEGGGIPTVGVSETTGSPSMGTFTDSNGIEWSYYDFTGSGSITFDADGYADILYVGGGGGSVDYGNNRYTGGGGGAVRYGLLYVTAGTHSIGIGGGGSGRTSQTKASDGGNTSLGSLYIAGGGAGGETREGRGYIAGVDHGGGDGGSSASGTSNNNAAGGGAGSGVNGLTLNYNDSNIEYGKGGDFATPVTNAGHGGRVNSGRTGSSGRLIVKVLA